MRTTGKEIAEYCDEVMQRRGQRIADLSRATGLRKELFSLWKSRENVSPTLASLLAISNYLEITVSQLIGQEAKGYSFEIKTIADMLDKLSPASVKAVGAVAKTYYDMELGEKTIESETAG